MTPPSEPPILSEAEASETRACRFGAPEIVRQLQHWHFAWGASLVLLVSALGVLLAAQGWRSHSPAHDLVPHIINAQNLLTGTIPVHGDTGSYGSYKPPGTAWLMLPSTLLFSDPRLAEYVGAGVLHLATLAGIFLLAYDYFGFWCACLAVSIYGLSSTGIMLAGSLWPNGRPDFFIWTVYFATRWAVGKHARSLAIAVAIWGIGMNVDMAILPAIFILPALWFVYRPPIHFKPLITAIGLVLLVWSPYLRLEAERKFADLRSQILLQDIFPANYRQAWCNPNIAMLASTSEPNASRPGQSQLLAGSGLMGSAVMLTNQIRGKLLYNFQGAAPFRGIAAAFLVMVVAGLIVLNVSGYRSETVGIVGCAAWWKDPAIRLALGMIVIGILANDFVVAHTLGIKALALPNIKTLRTIEKLLVFGGTSILAGKWTVALVRRLVRRAGIQIQSTEHAGQLTALALSLAIPWLLLLLVAEPGKPERFWWLWPLQSIFLAGFVVYILPVFKISRLAIWLSAIASIIIVTWNPYVLDHVTGWRDKGWAGIDAPSVQVVNYVTGDLEAQGRKQAAIGYHLFIYRFMPAYNITNPEYKVGMDFDLLFKYPHGITNTDQCAEGISPADEYRIVQTKPQEGEGTPRLYFDVPLDHAFELSRQFGPYKVFKRR